MSAHVPLPDVAAAIAGELAALAADAKTLAARLNAGDVVAAIVLPSNGLTDLLDIGGLRVAAELPPALLPGETITVQVVGFSGDRINLQVIATQPPPESAVPAPPRSAQPVADQIRAAIGRPAARPAAPSATAVPRRPPPPAASTAGPKAIEARLAASHAMMPGAGRPVGAPPAPTLRPLISMRPSMAAGSPRVAAQFAQPAALLRALHLPATATNEALARLALESPEKLPNALAVLERAVADQTDSRLATLSTLASFMARLEPGSPVLATQVAAYVDNVVTGREAKIAALLGAEPADPPSVARVEAARTALDYDLKSQLLALAAEPDMSAASGGKLDDAVAGALTALTAVQLKAAAALAMHPDGFAFTLPVMIAGRVVPARIRIAHDSARTAAADRSVRIGFSLETQRLGTVAVDLAAAGRAVSLGITAEGAGAAAQLEAKLGDLPARLERLDYRVTEARTVVAAPSAAQGVSAAVSVVDSIRHVDVDA